MIRAVTATATVSLRRQAGARDGKVLFAADELTGPWRRCAYASVEERSRPEVPVLSRNLNTRSCRRLPCDIIRQGAEMLG